MMNPTKLTKSTSARQGAQPGDAQVLSYRYPDLRKNNPEVGLVNEARDPEQPKTVYAYDPHLDPTLQFDSARAEAETMIDEALASDDPLAMRRALEELRRISAPYLQWTGKAERTSFEVDTVSLHVHERIDAMTILQAVSKPKPVAVQPSLFEAPFESLPLHSAIDFYKHDRGWANRLIAGDSLLVMNSLLQKEGMAGQVQMIYIDPPYGIKYGSNFQPFVGKRDVKDRSDADLTAEPEMIKAFRDTWELGIHSYLTYLRDRLLLAKDLLSETGSVFVQISDENLHLVRNLMDEVFGTQNFLRVLAFRKTGAQPSDIPAANYDFIVWYARNHESVKSHPIFTSKDASGSFVGQSLWTEDKHYARRLATKTEKELFPNIAGLRFFVAKAAQGAGPSGNTEVFPLWGKTTQPGPKKHWSTTHHGMVRLGKAGRLVPSGSSSRFVWFYDDFPLSSFGTVWDDTVRSGFGDAQVYVVETNALVIERCLLMTTDPGDLVLDPTCGSGTTAYVAEKWGRRWITCDTSRVAITLAKQRLMTASFDYFALRYPHEGIKGGFIYKTVPHVTLKSIANNPEIDAIYERLHPGIETALAALNAALAVHPPTVPFGVTEGVRKGQAISVGRSQAGTTSDNVKSVIPAKAGIQGVMDSRLRGNDEGGRGNDGAVLLEWEVPFDYPTDWPTQAQPLFAAFHTARQKMQAEMDRSIAAQADNETLYDQPEKTKNKLRITGPFTVEAVPFPTVLSIEERTMQAPHALDADLAVARTGHTSRQNTWRDELLKAGIRGKGGQMLKFAELEVLPGTSCLHASGHLDSGERVVISFGPEHAALEPRQVEHALREAGELFPLPKMIVFCAFAFDPEAAKGIDVIKGITALKAQMNTDMLTEDLKKAKSTNQSFWLMGQPDVCLSQTQKGLWQVEVNGFDYFDTAKGELVSGGKGKIAAWSLDTDYDGRSLFPRQVFFPMAGKDEGWMKLKKDIRAELDEDLLSHFVGTVSLPFEAGPNATVAVKIVDDRGIESLKVMKLIPLET